MVAETAILRPSASQGMQLALLRVIQARSTGLELKMTPVSNTQGPLPVSGCGRPWPR